MRPAKRVERDRRGGGRFGPGERGEHVLAVLPVAPDQARQGAGRLGGERCNLVGFARFRGAGRECVARKLHGVGRGATRIAARECTSRERDLFRGRPCERELELVEIRPAAHQLDRPHDGAVVAHGKLEHADRRDPLRGEAQRPGKLVETGSLLERGQDGIDPRAFELRPHGLGARVDRVSDEPAALVGEPRDDDVRPGKPRRALDDRRERRVEVGDSGRFPGHYHVCPQPKYGHLHSNAWLCPSGSRSRTSFSTRRPYSGPTGESGSGDGPARNARANAGSRACASGSR